jgi:hypothetical protein
MNASVCHGSEALSCDTKTLPALPTHAPRAAGQKSHEAALFVRLANIYLSRLPTSTVGQAVLTEAFLCPRE